VAPPTAKRLAWLDALRGIAALCVVFDHLTYSVLQPVRTSVYHWLDPGQYGVFVFFLVAVGVMIVLWACGIGSLAGMNSDPATSSFADVFMLQSVLWAPTLLTALLLGGVHRRSSRYALVFGAAAVALGGILNPGTLSYSLFTPGVVVAITDSVVLAGLVLALAGRGRSRIVLISTFSQLSSIVGD